LHRIFSSDSTQKPGLAVGLDLFQLHVLNDFPCLCSLPTEPSPEGLQLGDFTFVQRVIDILNLTKIHLFMVVHISHWGL